MNVAPHDDLSKSELVVRFTHPTLGKFEKAIKLSDLPVNPETMEDMLWTIEQMIKRKQWADAAKKFPVLLKRFPDDPNVLFSYARFLATCDEKSYQDFPKAVEIAQKALENLGNWEDLEDDGIPMVRGVVLDTLAIALHGAGKLKEAAEKAEEAAKLVPDNEAIAERAKSYRKDAEQK